MHRTLTDPSFRIADNTGLYEMVAEAIARQPDHLAELVGLMTAIQRRGVDLSWHWDCLVEVLCEEIDCETSV